MSPFYAVKLEQKGLNARLGGFRSFLAGKVFDILKYGDSVDSLAEMLMKFLSFHTASTLSCRSDTGKAFSNHRFDMLCI